MATPKPEDWNACLYDFAGVTIRDWIRRRYPSESEILDVGAGWGKYKLLLPEYVMDAVEIWPPYAEAVRHLYRRMFLGDICNLVGQLPQYDVVIFGDSLEHIAPEKAVTTIEALSNKSREIILAVPLRMPQDTVDDNPYEEHLQPDLTHELMLERYPSFTRLAAEKSKEVYTNRP